MRQNIDKSIMVMERGIRGPKGEPTSSRLTAEEQECNPPGKA